MLAPLLALVLEGREIRSDSIDLGASGPARHHGKRALIFSFSSAEVGLVPTRRRELFYKPFLNLFFIRGSEFGQNLGLWGRPKIFVGCRLTRGDMMSGV